MNTQNLIKRKLAQPESITVIRQILESDDELSRSAVAQRVCERLELRNARGRPQRAGCLKALRELERAGHFLLPTARQCPQRASPRRLGGPVDCVFVDAAHDYRSKKADCENALAMLAARGVILWHNYGDVCYPDVTRCLMEYAAHYPIFHLRNTSLAVMYRDRSYV